MQNILLKYAPIIFSITACIIAISGATTPSTPLPSDLDDHIKTVILEEWGWPELEKIHIQNLQQDRNEMSRELSSLTEHLNLVAETLLDANPEYINSFNERYFEIYPPPSF